MHSLATLALAVALPQQAVQHPLPPRTEQSPGVVAVVGATLYPVTSPPIEGGVMLVEGGRILAIGADLVVPPDASVLDFTGMTVMPGIVESHSHMGLKQLYRPETGSDNNELSKPINAEVRAIDGLATQDPAFALALAAGITTMHITTGSRSFASGQGVVVKLRGHSVDEMWFAEGGLKFAMRIQSRNQWRIPVPEILVMLGERLREAQGYQAALEAHARGERADPPEWNPQLEALGRALSRELPVGVHAHGVEPMRAAIALKDEFDLDLYIHHADATLVLAEDGLSAGAPVVTRPSATFPCAVMLFANSWISPGAIRTNVSASTVSIIAFTPLPSSAIIEKNMPSPCTIWMLGFGLLGSMTIACAFAGTPLVKS